MSCLWNSRPARRLLRPVRARLNQHTIRVTQQQIAASAAVHSLKEGLQAQQRATQEGRQAQQRITRLATTLDELRLLADHAQAAATASIGDLAGGVEELRSGLSALHREQSSASEQVREIVALVESFRSSLELLLGPTGRYVTRLISDEELRTLSGAFDFVSDHEAVAVALHQSYRMLVELELRGLGRFAGSTPNVLAKLSAVALLPPPTGEVLEIGTLFGLGAVGIMRQLARSDIEARLTIVDPVAGFQIQADRGRDLDISRTPATRTTVELNLALGGVGADRYRLVEGFSTDPEIREAIADRRYGLVIIDGDHGEEAAFADLVLAEAVAADGALVILDDYRDPAWPGVGKALERYLRREGARLELVGAAATSAFLRAAPAAWPHEQARGT